jgi:diguanylate cyclase (GGDEF)-like protein
MIKKSKKKQTHEKALTGGSLDANRINLSPLSMNIRILTATEAEDLRGESAELRVQIAGLHEETADLRQQTASLRKKATDLHEKTTSLREKALRAQNAKKKIAKEKAALSTHNESLLREANERLVVATINAQAMTETAEKATVQMGYMAEHDNLTGLPNRSLLKDRLSQSIMFAQRHGKKVALMYLDLDHFKHINDSLGHAVGDMLLKSVAKRLQSCIRLSDTVSRQGGDEFVVLLSEVEVVEDASRIAEKLITVMAKPILIDGHRLHITLSIGISFYPDDSTDIEAVIRNADTAMYQAKKKGRNNYQIFTPEMNIRAVARQAVEQTLHQAIEQNQFVLHYQPKVNLENGTITGAEALIRLKRSNHQLVCPNKFIRIAEDCGLILPIGRWVLREACRQAQAWLKSGLKFGQIAVNVSSREFHGKDFLAGIRAILDETGLAPHYLELELTESGLMQNTKQTTEILHTLKDLGVQIAIDDFGTGYSSLSYLQRFPIDTIKIDQSFVQDFDGDAGEAIVSAIIAMGTSLKQLVVAEGIETKQQLAFLQSHHCVEGQGFYFSQPLAADQFAKLLATGSANIQEHLAQTELTECHYYRRKEL